MITSRCGRITSLLHWADKTSAHIQEYFDAVFIRNFIQTIVLCILIILAFFLFLHINYYHSIQYTTQNCSSIQLSVYAKHQGTMLWLWEDNSLKRLKDFICLVMKKPHKRNILFLNQIDEGRHCQDLRFSHNLEPTIIFVIIQMLQMFRGSNFSLNGDGTNSTCFLSMSWHEFL